MKTYHFLLSILVMIIIPSGCDVSKGIRVINETSDTLSLCLCFDSIPPAENNDAAFYLANLLPPGSEITKAIQGSSNLKNETFSLFVYHEDTLRKYMNMRYIDTNNLYIRRYVLNYEELEKYRNVIRIR